MTIVDQATGSVRSSRSAMLPDPVWKSEQLMVVADVEFFVTVDLAEIHGHMSSSRHFLLGKNRPMIDAIVALREQNEIRRIVDLGIFKGGSVALYAKLFEPEKLVAIEYTASPVKPLAELIGTDGLTDRVKPFYGVDQSDRSKMKSILDEEFPDRNIDLVIDDASHFYQETRSSFNSIFPYLKSGGIYIVEDWGWAHWPGDTWQKSQAIPAWRPALSNLLFEICVLSASRSDLVAEVRVNSRSFMVHKGKAEMPREDFDLGGYTLTRDRWFKPLL
jgi:SAM-dependent methyltransferase